MNMIRPFSLFLLIVLLGACASAPDSGSGLEVGEQPATQVRPATGTSRPVLALLEQANQAARQGELAVAEARLERALRIEPRNAVLWYYMAKLRLHQGRLEEAAGLAAKSNSLDRRDNRRLQADNWRIIAHARHQSGDESGARDAEQRARALSSDD
ncbi:MAG: tetratricopeptide repeat protein [Thiohalophilus sp.]|uniref:tetratricopeptide repeat protein n=1 Tax=Thiohalophilus sp. TaxID=3028392 RepID=UPI00286FBABE|nr:tetratricopeptide repeat protein [Thiohalophilus sp.]MDR9435258.1 tetratricopeptide repeat protein [Thiohalophilus sp.]